MFQQHEKLKIMKNWGKIGRQEGQISATQPQNYLKSTFKMLMLDFCAIWIWLGKTVQDSHRALYRVFPNENQMALKLSINILKASFTCRRAWLRWIWPSWFLIVYSFRENCIFMSFQKIIFLLEAFSLPLFDFWGSLSLDIASLSFHLSDR